MRRTAVGWSIGTMTLAVPDSTPPAIDPQEARDILLAHVGSPRTWSTRRRNNPG